MHRITEVEALKDYNVRLKFTDGTAGTVDLSDMVGKGVFALWNDYRAFENVRIGQSGQLRWRDEVDLCPDWLYLRLTGKQPEEVFPNLKRGIVHA